VEANVIETAGLFPDRGIFYRTGPAGISRWPLKAKLPRLDTVVRD